MTISAHRNVEHSALAKSVASETGREASRRAGTRLGGWSSIAALIVLAVFGAYAASLPLAKHRVQAAIARELKDLGRTAYLPQKVVYHVDYDGGRRNQNYYNLLSALQNHERAVGKDKLQLVVMLQGAGTDFLALAKAKPRIASEIDALKRSGVRFLVCRNGLIDRAIDPFTDLYGVAKEDVVTAAVAELAALEQEGYVYLHL